MTSYKLPAAVFATLALIMLPATADSARAQSSKMESMKREINEQISERQKQVAERCEGASIVLEVDFASFGDNNYQFRD